jgi:hypothetical protein
MTFCGPARGTVLTNRQTEKLNFATCSIPRWVVYHLHGKPIRFEIVLMVSKISVRKSHKDSSIPKTFDQDFSSFVDKFNLIIY